MSLGNKFRILNVASVAIVVALAVVIFLAIKNQHDLNQAQEVRFESYRRANELRMSSEDLTRLARTYVITGDSRYEDMYWDILAVRNGQKARPDGTKVSLRKIMEGLGFTEDEFAKLKEAENNSNGLVTTETIAMNAVKGLYADGNGGYTRKDRPDPEMARRIMHDEKYHQDKELIMKPINEFDEMLDQRTKSTVDHYIKMGKIYFSIIGVLGIMTIVAILFIVTNLRSVLREVVAKLRVTSKNSTLTTDELMQTSQGLSEVAIQQSAAIQQTSSSMSEINSMANRTLESANKSSEMAAMGQKTALSGKDASDEVVSAIEEIKSSNLNIMDQVTAGNQQLTEIIQIISEIGSKTKVINDIVFQTKLLSFNASVEAARAGEHGKGFAVVAEEVGKLAQLSGNSAKEITQMLDKGIRKVDSIIKETTGRVEGLITQAKFSLEKGTKVAHNCGKSLNDVVEIVDQMSKMMEDIRNASSDQAKGIREITRAIVELDKSTSRNTEAAHMTESLADSLNKSNIEIKNLLQVIQREILTTSDIEEGGNDNHDTNSTSMKKRILNNKTRRPVREASPSKAA